MIPLNPEYVDPQGRTWHPFVIEFESEGAPFSFYVYALSRYHATLVLEDIKATGVVGGQIVDARSAT